MKRNAVVNLQQESSVFDDDDYEHLHHRSSKYSSYVRLQVHSSDDDDDDDEDNYDSCWDSEDVMSSCGNCDELSMHEPPPESHRDYLVSMLDNVDNFSVRNCIFSTVMLGIDLKAKIKSLALALIIRVLSLGLEFQVLANLTGNW